ncbi:formate hydrogenlyase maturation HycH family protein [Mannheimia massilioguelmaensis]|uniref:formate hydrogenlyase maturation HycH family protein n=1 Tax=Mannheimia massilioguelmaensis TaxID=1604354 RepID=UPI0005C800A2|nr:formate hydrogenlyase maturation HycH family protein [Mannheimia massilioguelmaensis]
MTTQVIFYLLNQRFMEKEERDDIPEEAKQVVYYSLAIGHHVGIVDCFKKLIVCDYDEYQKFVESFPEGEARRKFAGLIKFGEIVIDVSHVNLLAKALDDNKANFSQLHQQWAETLLDTLASIQREPVMYIMVKRRDNKE